jgi:hypothetical protein
MRHNPGWSGLIATAALAALLWAGASGSATGDPTDDADQAGEAAPARAVLHERVDGHRPLRGNPPAAEPPPAEPQMFDGYPDAPAFSVVPRKDHLQFFPCEDCHAVMPPNPQRRLLYSPHPATLEHGSGRIWCLDCHEPEDRNSLHTFAGEKVDFNDAYLVCGQCHYQPQKDWYYGGHGKRAEARWQGERTIYNCTHCHDPHAPALRQRAPEAPPPIRRGLEPMPVHAHHEAGHAAPADTGHAETDMQPATAGGGER